MDSEGIGATAQDVQRQMALTFGHGDHAVVLELLRRMEADVPAHSVHRVQVAALLVGRGDLEDLRSQVDLARTDYRDVLVSAFYRD